MVSFPPHDQPPRRSGAPGPAESAPVDPDFEALLDEIGVEDTEAVLAHGPLPVAPPSARSGLFVRGAAKGGSPWLNVASRLSTLIAVLLVAGTLGGVAYYGSSLVKQVRIAWEQRDRVTGKSATRSPGAIACAAGPVADSLRLPAAEQMPAVLAGVKALPRDPQMLQRAAARSMIQDGDRIDVFDLGPATLSVKYRGQTAAVRALLLNLRAPRPLCVALATAGLLAEAREVRMLRSGDVTPAEDSTAQLGDVPRVWVRGTPYAIEAVRISGTP